jgi:hypothetical protein
MGIIRLTLITAFLLWLGLKYFGRDEGLPDQLIGRAPEPAPVIAVTKPEPAPAEEPPMAEETAEAPPQETPEALDAAVADALSDVLTDALAPEAEAEPEAAPEPAPEPAAIAEPEPVVPAEPEPAPQPEAAPRLYVTGSMVNVRAGPATVYDVITALPHGAPVTDLGDAGEGWRIIQLDSGEIGYMSGDFLSPEAP